MAKILICVPSMDYVVAAFAQSLAMLQKKGHETAICFEIGSLVYESRNKLAKKAVEMGADYTMWFDSDMVFQPDTMLKLLEKNKDIVSGLYFRRSPPFSLVAFGLCDVKNRKWTDQPVPTELTTCGGVGFGCVLVKTDVLLEVAGKFGTWFEPMNGFGEDLSFCWRAKECGYEIFLDPDVKCGHFGHTVVTEEFSRAYGGAKNESKS